MKELIDLFLTFARVGVFTFGGGYAMLPMLQKEIVENKGWATDEELIDYYAIGQCTPGVIAVNTATFIGLKRKGIIGGAFATLGVIFPSVVIICVIAAFLKKFSSVEVVQHAFAAIRVAVGVLILNSVVKMSKTTVKGVWGVFVALAAFLAVTAFSASPVIVVLAAAFLGIGLPLLKSLRKKGEE
ncbi:MAG: chromate transporter [Lachnospiraceae bacterium]|nr:chromate transporter [Lachnospiraceae bacterium]